MKIKISIAYKYEPNKPVLAFEFFILPIFTNLKNLVKIARPRPSRGEAGEDPRFCNQILKNLSKIGTVLRLNIMKLTEVELQGFLWFDFLTTVSLSNPKFDLLKNFVKILRNQKVLARCQDFLVWTRRDLHPLLCVSKTGFYFINYRPGSTKIQYQKEKRPTSGSYLRHTDLARNVRSYPVLFLSIANPFNKSRLLWTRRVVAFLSILALVFSPFGNLVGNYLPQPVAEQVAKVIPKVQEAQAVDINDKMILFFNPASASSDTNLPSNWVCISCTATPTYSNYFPVGSTSFGTGGAATSTHTGTSVQNAGSGGTDRDIDGGTGNVTPTTHNHPFTTTIPAGSNAPLYGRLMMIKYIGPLPLTSLPDNVIGMFDVASTTSLPAGWSWLQTANDRIIIASDSADPANAGSDTHSHAISFGSLTAAPESAVHGEGTTSNRSVPTTHTHTAPVNLATSTISNVPQHGSLIFATTNGTVTSFTNVIAMFEATPNTTLWSVISGSGGVLENNFIEASKSYSATPGGANTHTHANGTSVASGGPSATDTGGAGSGAATTAHTHTLTVSSISTINHRPSYKGIIFAKGKVATNQTRFRWYNNGGTLDAPTSAISAEDIKASGSEALAIGTVYRLRLQMANNKTVNTTSDKFRLEMTRAGTSCTSLSSGWKWQTVPLTAVVASDAFDIELTADFVDGASTSANLLTAGATTFTNGYGLDNRATSGFQTINADNYTEFDWALKPSSDANTSADYCFRAMRLETGMASVSSDYTKIASASVQAAAPGTSSDVPDSTRRQGIGGGSIEQGSGGGTPVGGGTGQGTGGGSIEQGSGGGTPVGGGTGQGTGGGASPVIFDLKWLWRWILGG